MEQNYLASLKQGNWKMGLISSYVTTLFFATVEVREKSDLSGFPESQVQT